MKDKFYQFHYAEMNGYDVINLGIINSHFTWSVTKEDLKAYMRVLLNKPEARILISHVSQLTRSDFERLSAKDQQIKDDKLKRQKGVDDARMGINS